MKLKLDTKKIYLEMAERGLTITEIAKQGGVSRLNRMWTSSTERVALQL